MEVSKGAGGGGGSGGSADEPSANVTTISNTKTGEDDATTQEQEIRLLFFGTFFHENTGLTADLIQLKENARISEIRVIPLGATVDLSTGAFQLGATNPSEFDLEFYYNDLQVPAKSTFELLRNFKFNDKLRIQLICTNDECIITDGLLVRGIYSTVTLAVYGYTVDKVPIKEEEKVETPMTVKESSSLISDSGPTTTTTTISSPMKDSSPKVKPLLEANAREISVDKEIGIETDTELGDELSLLSKSSKTTDDVVADGSPKAIPTITTRVNYDALPGSSEVSEIEDIQGSTEVEESPRSMDHTVESVDPPESTAVPLSQSQPPVIPPIVDDMDVEEISDGEVFPSDDEDEVGDKEPPKAEQSIQSPAASGNAGSEPMDFENTPKKTDSLVEEIEPIISPVEPVSDGDGSLIDEFQEPGIEEIISDEDLPDFPDYDEAEWEDHWAHRFKNFNPYSDSFGVNRLHNITVSHTSKEVCNLSIKECWNMLVVATEKYSGAVIEGDMLESLIEDIENLLPIIPRAVQNFDRCSLDESSRVKRSILKWVDMSTEISLALNQSSLPFIVRHLKAGISLVQCIANLDSELADEVITFRCASNINADLSHVTVQHRLLQLMNEPNTKNSRLRVLVLRAIDATVSTRNGLEMFLHSENPNYDESLQKKLVDLAVSSDREFSTRMSYSLRSLQKKIKLMQGLNTIEDYVKNSVSESGHFLDGFPAEITVEWNAILQDLKETASHVDQFFSFPIRIIPAESVLELPPLGSPGHDPKYSFVKMLHQYNFVQVASVILNSRNVSLELVSQIVEIIEIVSQWEAGLIFLCNSEKATTLLIRSLLQFDDDVNYLGLLLAHSIEVMACIDALSNEESMSFEEEMKINEMMHTLMNFKTTHIGREALVNVLTKGNFIQPILKSIQQWEEKLLIHPKTQQRDIHSHTGYAVEILEFIIRKCGSVDFLQKHGSIIYNLISSLEEKHESFKKLTDVLVYLNPTLSDNFFGLHNLNKCIELLCDRVKSCVDTSSQPKIILNAHWGISGEVITCLRILAQLADPPFRNELVINTSELRIRELKYDLALAKIHEQDLKTTIISILQKILDDVIHAPLLSFSLVTQKGDFLLSLLQPSLKLLQRMISQVVKTRKTEYRDITPVPVLVGVYGLIYYFPSRSASSPNMQKLTQTILDTLLSYTVPAVKQGAETEEELNKSIWTGTISSIIKYILERPVNFLPGLALLSEMLPLPFPVASNSRLSDDACSENVKLRRLWSAYIHGLTSQLQDLVYTLCNSNDCKLQNLLKRVCVQLGDLSPSTCLLICRAILDMLLFLIEKDKTENSINDESPNNQGFQCTLVTSRLLGFLGSLINNFAPIKCGILQILRSASRVDEKYSDLITLLCCILSTPGSSLTMNNRHVQAQDNILTIFQSFCDVEINMLIPIVGQTDKKFDWNFILTNSLPQRDHIIMICSALLKNLSLLSANITDSVQILEGVLRSMEIIAETDYGFYYLKTALDKTSGVLHKVCQILATLEVDNLEIFEGIVPTIISFLDLLKTMTTSRPQQMGSYPPRLSVLKPEDLVRYLQWTSDSITQSASYKVASDSGQLQPKAEDSKSKDLAVETEDEFTSTSEKMESSETEKVETKTDVHPLLQLKTLFEQQLKLIRESGYALNNIEVTEIENGLSCIVNLIQFLNETKPAEVEAGLSEVILPNPESLSELYCVRPVYVIVDKPNHETLPLFWMTGVPPAFELDPDTSESDMIPCNFKDLTSPFPNFDLAKEIEGLFKKSEVNSKENDSSSAGQGNGANKDRTGSALMSSPHMMHYQGRRGHQFGPSMRGTSGRGGFNRNLLPGAGRMGNMIYDPFRSRPPNTSRPPSLHVDDFVALESSGTSGGGPMRTNTSDAYAPRGRGAPRGSGLLSRPYSHDRGGRNPRSGPGQGQFYLTSRNEPPTSAAKGSRASRGGRIYSTPTSDRWTADNRGGSHSYDRTSARPPSNTYDDKYRSGSVGPNRNPSNPGSPRTSHLSPYPQRSSSSSYRDARSSPSSSNPRFRDRPKPFNR